MFWIPLCLHLLLKPVGCTWVSQAVLPLRDGFQKQTLLTHLKPPPTKTPPESPGSYLLPEDQGKATIPESTEELKGPLSSFICPSQSICLYSQFTSGPGLNQKLSL